MTFNAFRLGLLNEIKQESNFSMEKELSHYRLLSGKIAENKR
jgi:hypothetical protein